MLDLTELDVQIENTNGKPLELPLADVMEDPSQPRVEFPELEMKKIAESIKQRGVKTPISVHIHPNEKGKYIINHGARRYRGSIMAGKETIPAFIDESHTDYDQVMENKERLGHTPIEIALFIKKKLDEGEKKGVIAKKLNENAVYVTTHLALIDMPEVLAKAYNAGCKSPKTLYDLRNLLEEYPEAVEKWILESIEKGQDIYRSGVQALAKELKKPKQAVEAVEETQNLSIAELQDLQKQAENLVKGAVNVNESAIEQSFEEVEPTPADEVKDAVNANESAIEQSFEEVEPTPADEVKDAVNANESAIEQSFEEVEPTPADEVKDAVNANESAIEQSFEEVEPTPADEVKDAVNANESAIEQSFEEVEPTPADEVKDAVNAELKQPQVRVIFEGKDAVLILYKAPRSRGFAWIEFLADGEQKEVDCSLLEIESILEG